jgi:hypothetical protein
LPLPEQGVITKLTFIIICRNSEIMKFQRFELRSIRHHLDKATLRIRFHNLSVRLDCNCWIWGSRDRASLTYSFKYNQQDATLYNILYYCQCSTCFRWFLRPSSGAQNCTHTIWYMSSLLLLPLAVAEARLTAVPFWSCSKAVYKLVWHTPLLSVQWINSWWWTEELSETSRVSCQNKFVKLVHLVCFIMKKPKVPVHRGYGPSPFALTKVNSLWESTVCFLRESWETKCVAKCTVLWCQNKWYT